MHLGGIGCYGEYRKNITQNLGEEKGGGESILLASFNSTFVGYNRSNALSLASLG